MRNVVLTGDAVEMLKTIESETVQCCVTSPPYWGLRDYGVDGQLGLEKVPELYVAKMVEVFREVKRVLRKDGTLWLNLGDSYCGGGRGFEYWTGKEKQSTNAGSAVKASAIPMGMKAKDLCGIPWMVAFALRADGWYLRSDVIEEVEMYCPCGCGYVMQERVWRYSQDREIIWKKPNPMPESVTDRPTKSHEYIFLLTKSAKYYYDAMAIAEPLAYPDETRRPMGSKGAWEMVGRKQGENDGGKPYEGYPTSRNKRSVWEVTTQPFKGAHFATFPEEIPTICIKAGTSEKGQCAKCGKPVVRVIERVSTGKSYAVEKSSAKRDAGLATAFSGYDDGSSAPVFKTTGWRPSCGCDDRSVPQIVLDPFAGSGTTLEVAKRLGRDYIGIELSEKYVKELVEPRLANIDPLFNVEV